MRLQGLIRKHILPFRGASSEDVRLVATELQPTLRIRTLAGSPIPRSLLIVTYMSIYNWTRYGLEIIKAQDMDGYHHIDLNDCRGAQPSVWTRRDTGPLVKELIEDLQPGTRLAAVTQKATYREFMVTWDKVGSKKLAGDGGIKQVSEEDYMNMIPGDEHIKEHVLECWNFSRDFSFTVGISSCSPGGCGYAGSDDESGGLVCRART
jgi:hypothetical protein